MFYAIFFAFSITIFIQVGAWSFRFGIIDAQACLLEEIWSTFLLRNKTLLGAALILGGVIVIFLRINNILQTCTVAEKIVTLQKKEKQYGSDRNYDKGKYFI